MSAEKPFKVHIIESERDWGQRLDEVREFATEEEREAFIKDFNKDNTLPYVPDWYMFARKGN
jgi:hypothetical protein